LIPSKFQLHLVQEVHQVLLLLQVILVLHPHYHLVRLQIMETILQSTSPLEEMQMLHLTWLVLLLLMSKPKELMLTENQSLLMMSRLKLFSKDNLMLLKL
jgi:hypothetical protein